MTTKEKVMAIIAIQVHAISIRDDLRKDLKLDSLDEVELLIAFEKEFNIQIDEGKYNNFHTVGDVVELIENLIGNRNGSNNNRTVKAAH